MHGAMRPYSAGRGMGDVPSGLNSERGTTVPSTVSGRELQAEELA